MSTMEEVSLFVALPVMDEKVTLPRVLDSLFGQSIQDFRLFICVNQPDTWWDDPAKRRVCEDNSDTLEILRALNDPRIVIIDKSSPGNGWLGKSHGIGWARKTIMDSIASVSGSKDLIVSLDADTTIGSEYLASILENASLNTKAVAFSIPYYHQLTGDEGLDRAMLRYEIYMRSYSINLWRIQSPYSFTALGSSIALPVWAYKAIGGMTPKLSGEDFYFLQKLTKYGPVLHWNREVTNPATRLSERVFFGTGPALIKGISGDWESYPVYRMHLFDNISKLYQAFPVLYSADVPTSLDEFILNREGKLPWSGIRKNSKSVEQFVRACHEKIDGLRILQYLKDETRKNPYSDESAAIELLKWIIDNNLDSASQDETGGMSFTQSSVTQLNRIRDILFRVEMNYRHSHWKLKLTTENEE